ncbi:MAG: hypothetical protein GY940_38000 [bacterium]|nr:hypothetical protein [bacterium]
MNHQTISNSLSRRIKIIRETAGKKQKQIVRGFVFNPCLSSVSVRG